MLRSLKPLVPLLLGPEVASPGWLVTWVLLPCDWFRPTCVFCHVRPTLHVYSVAFAFLEWSPFSVLFLWTFVNRCDCLPFSLSLSVSLSLSSCAVQFFVVYFPPFGRVFLYNTMYSRYCAHLVVVLFVMLLFT